jgi:hypothetical protein
MRPLYTTCTRRPSGEFRAGSKLLARRGKETSGPSGWIASLHAERSIAEGEGLTIGGDGDLRLTS